MEVIVKLNSESDILVECCQFTANTTDEIPDGGFKALLELIELRLIRKLDMGEELTVSHSI
jgi:hypothetical protein